MTISRPFATDEGEEQLLIATAKELGERFGLDYWFQHDTAGTFPEELWQALAEDGWAGLTIPELHGGSGLGLRVAAQVIEMVAAGGGGSTVGQVFMGSMLPAATVLRSGTEVQRASMLPELATGQAYFGIALTEPDAGSNALATATRAEPVDGGYRLQGQKIYITAVERATQLQVLARTSSAEESGRSKGLTLFTVDTTCEGITHAPMAKLGTHCLSTSMLYLDGAFVAHEDVIGPVGEGWKVVVDALNVERIITTAAAIGAGELALALASAYARERTVFGKPIGANQAIAFPLARAKAELACARLLNLHAASLYDAGLACAAEGNMAKLVGTDACFAACDSALQTFGGAGYMSEQHIERLWRDARLWKIAPVSQEMVLSFVAQNVLGLPRSY
jgi:acyl-CoA dehydrogenase